MNECVLCVVFVVGWITGMIDRMMVERLKRRRCEGVKGSVDFFKEISLGASRS